MQDHHDQSRLRMEPSSESLLGRDLITPLWRELRRRSSEEYERLMTSFNFQFGYPGTVVAAVLLLAQYY